MKAIIELSIEAEDGATWMVLETEIPVSLHGGDCIAACGCCDPLKIDDELYPPVWDMGRRAMKYTCWKDVPEGDLETEVGHFILCGFVEKKESREMYAR